MYPQWAAKTFAFESHLNILWTSCIMILFLSLGNINVLFVPLHDGTSSTILNFLQGFLKSVSFSFFFRFFFRITFTSKNIFLFFSNHPVYHISWFYGFVSPKTFVFFESIWYFILTEILSKGVHICQENVLLLLRNYHTPNYFKTFSKLFQTISELPQGRIYLPVNKY